MENSDDSGNSKCRQHSLDNALKWVGWFLADLSRHDHKECEKDLKYAYEYMQEVDADADKKK